MELKPTLLYETKTEQEISLATDLPIADKKQEKENNKENKIENKTANKENVQISDSQLIIENETTQLIPTLYLDFGDLVVWTDDQLLLLSAQNPHLQIELNSKQQLAIKMPTKFDTANYNAEISADLIFWNRQYRLGKVTDSNGGFHLPVTNAVVAPDVAFVLHSKLETIDTKKGFPCLAPDFVIELRSDSDVLQELIDKMLDYIANGVRLGWLINPKDENIYIYRLNGNHTTQTFDEKLTGEDVLPNFELNPRNIFNA